MVHVDKSIKLIQHTPSIVFTMQLKCTSQCITKTSIACIGQQELPIADKKNTRNGKTIPYLNTTYIFFA